MDSKPKSPTENPPNPDVLERILNSMEDDGPTVDSIGREAWEAIKTKLLEGSQPSEIYQLITTGDHVD